MRTDSASLLATGETETVEFKSSLADTKRIIDTVAAMATLGGGVILVGVRDDGRVLGAELGEGAIEQLAQRILAATDPRVYVHLRVESVGERPVLRIEVPPGDGPHLSNGRAFTRSGPATVQMSRDEYERRLLDRLRESAGFERQPLPETTLDDLDLAAIRRFAELAAPRGVSWDGDVAALLDRLHLLREGAPTVGALLLFGREPQRALPQATVRLHVQRGDIEEGDAIEGGLIAQIEGTVQRVAMRMRRQVDRAGLVRAEVSELPATALREVVVNAIAHRDYRSTAPIQVRLDDARLVVWNPGHLPAPLTVAALRRAHPSVPPNPRIARALYLAGLVEEWGTGTLRIVASMAEQGNPEPVFEAELGGLSVTLPLRGAAHTRLSERQAAVLAAVQSSPTPKRTAELSDALSVSLRTVQNELSALEDLGLVARVGRGKALRWARVS